MTTSSAETTSSSDLIGRPVQRAIFERRSIKRFAPRPVEPEVIERLLEAAVQAPQHHRTNPWRFYVFATPGPSRERLAELAFDAGMERSKGPDDEPTRLRAEVRRQQALNTPVIVIVFTEAGRDDLGTEENYGAVMAAMQNLSLAAVEEGLVTGWTTGGFATHPALRSYLGVKPGSKLGGALFIGYPDPSMNTMVQPRPTAHPSTVWVS
jgi:nitroreductase